MIGFDDVSRRDIKEHKSHLLSPSIILIFGGSRWRKANALLNPINHQPDTSETFILRIYIIRIHLIQNISFQLAKPKV